MKTVHGRVGPSGRGPPILPMAMTGVAFAMVPAVP
jgi:hypothetical protein